jgi:hypothetical protein
VFFKLEIFLFKYLSLKFPELSKLFLNAHEKYIFLKYLLSLKYFLNSTLENKIEKKKL